METSLFLWLKAAWWSSWGWRLSGECGNKCITRKWKFWSLPFHPDSLSWKKIEKSRFLLWTWRFVLLWRLGIMDYAFMPWKFSVQGLNQAREIPGIVLLRRQGWKNKSLIIDSEICVLKEGKTSRATESYGRETETLPATFWCLKNGAVW